LLSLTNLFAQSITLQNQPATPPQVRITLLRRFDQNVPLSPVAQNLAVRHYDNYLEIAFAAVDSLPVEKLTFRYRLAGVDTGWMETQQQFVQYKNLEDGQYAFEVLARYEWSIWSGPARLDFVLHRRFGNVGQIPPWCQDRQLPGRARHCHSHLLSRFGTPTSSRGHWRIAFSLSPANTLAFSILTVCVIFCKAFKACKAVGILPASPIKFSCFEMNFWSGTFGLVIFALIEVILFAWVFGMEDAWQEINAGADIRIPEIFKFIIQFVAPVYLILLLLFWRIQQDIPTLLMTGQNSADIPCLWGARLMMAGLAVGGMWLVARAYQRGTIR
jgi:hypothetical protein